MNSRDWVSLLQSWNVTPVVVIWLSVVAGLYVRGWWVFQRRMLRQRNFQPRPADRLRIQANRFPLRRLLSFVAGLAIVFVALQSPLDVAAAFSLQVHMVQHLLLMIVAPPLLLYGTPTLPIIAGLPKSFRDNWVTPFVTWKPLRRSLGLLAQPAVAWVLFTSTLWVWHSPQLYVLALQSENWHRIEHACFLVSSFLFWWPVFAPYPFRAKYSRWILVPYLFLGGVQGSALAAILTFSPRVIYSHYNATPNVFGIDPLTDQSLAGAIMWVPMGVAFLIAIVIVVGEQFSVQSPGSRWAGLSEHESARDLPRRNSRSRQRLSVSFKVRRPRLPRVARRTLQFLMLLIAALVIVDGLTGPQVSAINLAGVLPWIHWRGFLVIVIVLGGNYFCMICPFTLFRTTIKRVFKPQRRWPKTMQNKWLAIALLVLFFWSYEAFSLWDRPMATAMIIVGYFVAVVLIDALFVEAPFCKFVCPIGQFNFVHSLVSPTQVAIADRDVCSRCITKDCIAGNEESPGCQTYLFQPAKHGNMDCTFCMDCVDACPHDNVAVFSIGRLDDLCGTRPRQSLGTTGQHSSSVRAPTGLSTGMGSSRFDIAMMIVLLFFAALVNAAWMTAPMIAIEDSLVERFGIGRLPVMSAGFLFMVIGVPILVMQAVASMSNHLIGLDGNDEAVRANIAKFARSLIPLSLSMWLAHYCFHLATSFGGWRIASERAIADWTGGTFEVGPIEMACCKADTVPWLLPMELTVLAIGLCASFVVVYRIGNRREEKQLAAVIPWVSLMLVFYAACVWVLMQPMQMRGAMNVGL